MGLTESTVQPFAWSDPRSDENISDGERARRLAHEAWLEATFPDPEPEHVCGPWPYLFEGDCPGCQWRMDRA